MFIVRFTLPMLVAVKAGEDLGAAGVMACYTRNIMISDQRECMLEVGWHPGVDRVALHAILRKAKRHMIRCGLIVCTMARVAVRRESGIDVANMALRTIQSPMPTGQSEERMFEGRGCPGIDAVALLAIE